MTSSSAVRRFLAPLLAAGLASACATARGGAGSTTGGQVSSTGLGTSSGGATTSSPMSSSGGSGATGTSGLGGTTGSRATCPAPSGAGEFQSCGSTCQCAPPLVCTRDQDLQVSLCEQTCQTLTDCASLLTTCNGLTCAPVPCGAQFGSAFDGPCNFADAGLGSCVSFGGSFGYAFDWLSVGLCSQGGPLGLGMNCDVAQPSRALDAGDLCVGGTICAPNASSSSQVACTALCDPRQADTCAGGAGCLVADANAPFLGVCAAVNGGSGGSPPCRPPGSSCAETYLGCCSHNCNAGTCE